MTSGAKDHVTMVEPMRPEGAANEPTHERDSAAPASAVDRYLDRLDREACALEDKAAGIRRAIAIIRGSII